MLQIAHNDRFMRYLIVFIIAGLIQYNGFSQVDFKRIKVSKDIELIKLSENAYVHVSYSDLPKFGRYPSNGLIFINKSEAFLFDTPMTDSLTMDLVSWLNDSMKLKIVGFVPNHWHNDCMGGLRFLRNQKIESYANQMTIDIAKSKELPIPKHGFKDSIQLPLGDKLIKCYYFGAAHSLDNIVVWIPSEQILFAGCMIKSINSKDLGNTVDGDLLAYPKTIDKLINKFPSAKIVIPGHGQFGGLDLIKHTRKLSNYMIDK
jgi:metallo-beta-lactamase class B